MYIDMQEVDVFPAFLKIKNKDLEIDIMSTEPWMSYIFSVYFILWFQFLLDNSGSLE